MTKVRVLKPHMDGAQRYDLGDEYVCPARIAKIKASKGLVEVVTSRKRRRRSKKDLAPPETKAVQ